MEAGKIQAKLFELGELWGNALVAEQYGHSEKAAEFKASAERILSEFAEMKAHIEIFSEKQYQMPGRRNKCNAEKILKRCHGGEMQVWIHIAIVIDGTNGHPEARLGDIDTSFDLDYEYDDCDEDGDDSNDGHVLLTALEIHWSELFVEAQRREYLIGSYDDWTDKLAEPQAIAFGNTERFVVNFIAEKDVARIQGFPENDAMPNCECTFGAHRKILTAWKAKTENRK